MERATPVNCLQGTVLAILGNKQNRSDQVTADSNERAAKSSFLHIILQLRVDIEPGQTSHVAARSPVANTS
jgi:hypothetical protein